MQVPVIETERLRLRGWQQSDATSLAALNADADFVRYIGAGKPLSPEESWRVMAMLAGHWVLRGFGLWAVELKANGAFIGRVGLLEPEGWPQTEIGWGIDPAYWGKGYASEAASAAMAWAFNELGVKALISIIHPDNHASKRLAERLGEVFSHQQTVLGTCCDIYQIDRETYLKTRSVVSH
ncbi:GNAT family N-acetyltransferase [Thaumasiovibrio subtropicus]|uniref:GNAT family N-acetyltransferase n=1 Tax=Thaumasiovibrio subtropicus TaxID=1891207 RepID=UPI000B35BBD5|nr:GNAT family N-acetyltransferase [Thaumasiovibrio subtropicus]